MSELLDAAEREVRTFVTGLGYEAPLSSDLVRLLETLHQAELVTDTTRQRLIFLVSSGAATRADVTDYDTLRRNVFRAQMRMYTAIASATPNALITQIPRPQLAPAVDAPDSLASGPGIGLRALGNPGAAAGVAVATSPWFWAGIVLTVIVALGILAAIVVGISVTSEAISGVAVAWVQSKAYSAFLDRRWAAYQGCLAEGRSPAECTELARALVPQPEFTSAGSTSFWTTLKWAAIIGGVGLVGAYGYNLFRRHKRRRLVRLLADE